ncbi:MAG TPA: hypothetical protein VFY99_11570 [Solirubrobacterales bacterium]
MALAQDQRAMLQLLLERGQSYEDIAGLLGGSRDDARRRARAALEELGGSDPDREVGLTDYLLGQADPIGRADVVRHLQSDPAALAQAEELSAKLRLLAPDADLPDLPQPKKRRRAAAAAVSPASPGGDVEAEDENAAGESRVSRLGAGLSTHQTRMFAGLAAGAVILLFAVLAIAGVFSSDDEGATPEATTTTAEGEVGEEVTTVNLRPAGGGDAGGEAIFGIANETQPFLDLRLAGLDAPPEGQTYVVWFLLEEDRGYPLAPITITENGGFDDRFPIPQSALPVVVRTQSVDIALVDNRALAGDIQKALQGREVLLDYSGESILRGRIPRLETPPGGAEDLAPPEGTGGGAGAAIPEDLEPTTPAP